MFHAQRMPAIDLAAISNGIAGLGLDSDTRAEYNAIAATIVGRGGVLRASKPKSTKKVSSDIAGKGAYVWRMVAFTTSCNPQHHCMPTCADFDLPAYDETGKWRSSLAREMSKPLDTLADVVLSTIPGTKHYGTHRYAKAFGIV